MLKKLIEEILKFTEQRDLPALNHLFLKTINLLFSPVSATLYDLLDDKGNSEFKGDTLGEAHYRNIIIEENHNGLPLSSREDFCECITDRLPVRRRDAGRSVDIIIYPVFGEEGVTSLLVLEHGCDEQIDLNKFEYLLRAYSNHRKFLISLDSDPLTGLLNRRAFDRYSYEIARTLKKPSRRSSDEHDGISFAIIDIDHFKLINDTYGHLFGDDILILLARIISESFRHYDLSFRYGGEEFCIILYHLDAQSALKLMERFRKKVEAFNFPQIGTMTVTVGLTVILKEDQPSHMIDRADKALYYGKEHGRNRVCSFEDLLKKGLVSDKQPTGGWQVF